ncbi:MAG: dipeptide/oligopeptide/nickel ABC transporter ATP-binding protein, partial [Treponema sp.]|nr:dipeptide/oligopeptide/nickel ABC transporter ATP-binding protein [Treponema sp.]
MRPGYLLESIRKLPALKRRLGDLYRASGDSAGKAKDPKEAGNLFRDLARIFGGLLLAENDTEVSAAYHECYFGSGKGDTSGLDALRKAVRDRPGTDGKTFADLESLRDEGIDLARLSYDEMRLLRRDMQIIFQDPYSSLNPRMTVGQIIGEGPLAHGFFPGEGEALQNHVMTAMEKCGLAPYMIHRYPHQFSGGQRQRIGIARALAVNPKFVVCDEAVSALDVSIQSQILNLLSDLKEEANLTYLFISHGLSVVKYISDRIGVMY